VLEARGAVEDGVGVLSVDGEDDGVGHGDPPDVIARVIGAGLHPDRGA